MIPISLQLRRTMRSFTGEETLLGIAPITSVFIPPTVQTEADREIRYFEDQYSEITYSEIQYTEMLYYLTPNVL